MSEKRIACDLGYIYVISNFFGDYILIKANYAKAVKKSGMFFSYVSTAEAKKRFGKE